jgi:putative spermidine/putrescine transport system permease protein
MMALARGRGLPWNIYGAGRGFVELLAFAVAALLVLPTFFIIPISLSSSRIMFFPPEDFSWRWYRAFFETPGWIHATIYSVVLAILTTLAALAIGLPAAFGLARGRFSGRQALTILFVSPLIIPSILIAISEYFFLTDLGLTATTLGLVIAHTILALPFVVIIVVATLRGFDRSYERAAMSLSATPLRTFWYVTLPLIRPGVISAALFAFLASFSEFLTSLFIIGPTRTTLPIQLWRGIRFEQSPTIAAAATMMVLLSVVMLLVVELARWQARRRQFGERGTSVTST